MFETILKMSLYGSAAALLVMLLRLVPKIPPRVKFILWGLIFLRLIIPPGVFTVPSPVSMQTVIPEQAILAALPSTTAPLATNPQMPGNAREVTAAPESTAAPNAQPPFDWVDSLEKIWLIGVSACVALMVSTYLRVFRREKYETVIKGVYASDHFVSPAVIGLLRPKIVLPISINPESAADIILHERTHIRRGDHITKLLFAFVAALHWFNPIVWLAYVLAVRDMEMAVDEAVLTKSGGDIRKQYAAALLNVAQERMLAFPGFGESDIKRRVKGVLRFKKPSRWIAVLSALLVIAAGAFLLTGNTPTTNTQPQEPLYTFKNQYVGDNSNTVGLLHALSYGDALAKTELLTEKEPYGIVATYDFVLFNSIPESFEQAWEDNAAVIFALISNVDEIYFNSGANTYYTAYRKDFEVQLGQDLREFAKDEAAFVAFLDRIRSRPSPSPTPATSPEEELYRQASVMIGEKRYPQAMGMLAELGDYGKSKETLEHLRYIMSAPYISAGAWSVAAMTSDGGVIYINNDTDDHLEDALKWTDMRAICIKSDYFIEGVSNNGEIHVTPRVDKKDLGAQGAPGPGMVELVESIESWKNIKAYDATYPQSAIALTGEGEVYAAYPTGKSFFGKLPGWTDMVAVSDGRGYAAGLKSDGTVLTACSEYYSGTLDTSDWRDIVAIDASHCLVGLKSDGTCVSTGINDRGQGDVSGWTDIIAISTHEGVTLGLKRDGTVVAAGDNQYGQMDVSGWKDIVAIDVGFYITIGLKADGTMVVTGDCSNVNMGLPEVSTLKNLYVPSPPPPMQ